MKILLKQEARRVKRSQIKTDFYGNVIETADNLPYRSVRKLDGIHGPFTNHEQLLPATGSETNN